MKNRLDLERIFFHRDYDGAVAAAMVGASCKNFPDLHWMQYTPDLNWRAEKVREKDGVVDFLFHPFAGLWVDHHETTFGRRADREQFKADDFHVFDPNALSCPSVIKNLPWFGTDARWDEYVRWSEIIDSALYETPGQANDLRNPHLMLSHLIARVSSDEVLFLLVQSLASLSAEEVVELPELKDMRGEIFSEETELLSTLARRLTLHGEVALLDQADLAIPFRRYLPYQECLTSKYAVGLYKNGESTIVSVGENPWNRTGSVHLGILCRKYGGGGRRSAAGIPVSSAAEARILAKKVIAEINERLAPRGEA